MNGETLRYRPPNVVGSYAVYGIHENNQYESGKLFHLYRPLLIDTNGLTSWGSWNLTGNVLTLTADMTFLVNAVYPIVIDPVFGYETIGATAYTIAYSGTEVLIGSIFPGAAGTATNIAAVFYTASPTGNRDISVGMYLHSDLSLVYGDPSNIVSLTTTATFKEFTIPDTSISAVDYLPVVWADYEYASKNIYSRYDSGDTNQRHGRTLAYNPASWPNPFGTATHGTEKFSIHVDYTAEAGGKNLYFNLTAVPAITATLYSWKALFKGLSQAPGSIADLAFGRAFIRSFSNIPTTPNGYIALRALMYPFETVPTYIMDSSFGLGKIAEVTATITPAIVTSLASNKALAFALSGAPKFIADLSFAIESGVTFILSIAPGFTTDIKIGKELFRALAGAPAFITSLTKEIELSFIEYILPETIHVIADLNTILQAAANLEITFALAALAFILAITALSMIFLKKKD